MKASYFGCWVSWRTSLLNPHIGSSSRIILVKNHYFSRFITFSNFLSLNLWCHRPFSSGSTALSGGTSGSKFGPFSISSVTKSVALWSPTIFLSSQIKLLSRKGPFLRLSKKFWTFSSDFLVEASVGFYLSDLVLNDALIFYFSPKW